MTRVYDKELDDADVSKRAAAGMVLLDRALVQYREQDLELLGFSVRLPAHQGDEFFLVARFDRGGERLVSFKSADTLIELMAGFMRSLQYQTLKLREDKYEPGND